MGWTHAYQGITPPGHKWGEGIRATIYTYGSPRTPGEMPAELERENDTEVLFRYVKSWDHEPTDAEKLEIDPDEDDPEPLVAEEGL